jgi:hypothetical protein
MQSLPPSLEALADELAGMDGVVAVALGGSRALGVADAGSDWDLAVYYRGAVDTTALALHGAVYPPGSWGRIMNGGAWLKTADGAEVDVLLRDLDVAEAWCERATEGVYEVDALLGYIAGVPTYSLLAERAVGITLRGTLDPAPTFPPRLAASAQARWRFHAGFSLDHATMRAARGDVAGAVGQAAKAVVEYAHAILCEQRAWVLNEKRILERAGLAALHGFFTQVPRDPPALACWVARLRGVLSDVPPPIRDGISA